MVLYSRAYQSLVEEVKNSGTLDTSLGDKSLENLISDIIDAEIDKISSNIDSSKGILLYLAQRSGSKIELPYNNVFLPMIPTISANNIHILDNGDDILGGVTKSTVSGVLANEYWSFGSNVDIENVATSSNGLTSNISTILTLGILQDFFLLTTPDEVLDTCRVNLLPSNINDDSIANNRAIGFRDLNDTFVSIDTKIDLNSKKYEDKYRKVQKTQLSCSLPTKIYSAKLNSISGEGVLTIEDGDRLLVKSGATLSNDTEIGENIDTNIVTIQSFSNSLEAKAPQIDWTIKDGTKPPLSESEIIDIANSYFDGTETNLPSNTILNKKDIERITQKIIERLGSEAECD